MRFQRLPSVSRAFYRLQRLPSVSRAFYRLQRLPSSWKRRFDPDPVVHIPLSRFTGTDDERLEQAIDQAYLMSKAGVRPIVRLQGHLFLTRPIRGFGSGTRLEGDCGGEIRRRHP